MMGASGFSLRSPVRIPRFSAPNRPEKSLYLALERAFRGDAYQARPPVFHHLIHGLFGDPGLAATRGGCYQTVCLWDAGHGLALKRVGSKRPGAGEVPIWPEDGLEPGIGAGLNFVAVQVRCPPPLVNPASGVIMASFLIELSAGCGVSSRAVLAGQCRPHRVSSPIGFRPGRRAWLPPPPWMPWSVSKGAIPARSASIRAGS